MGGIATGWIVTTMKAAFAVFEWADVQLIHQAMHHATSATSRIASRYPVHPISISAVTPTVQFACPNPTGGRIIGFKNFSVDLLKKAFCDRMRNSHAVHLIREWFGQGQLSVIALFWPVVL